MDRLYKGDRTSRSEERFANVKGDLRLDGPQSSYITKSTKLTEDRRERCPGRAAVVNHNAPAQRRTEGRVDVLRGYQGVAHHDAVDLIASPNTVSPNSHFGGHRCFDTSGAPVRYLTIRAIDLDEALSLCGRYAVEIVVEVLPASVRHDHY